MVAARVDNDSCRSPPSAFDQPIGVENQESAGRKFRLAFAKGGFGVQAQQRTMDGFEHAWGVVG